MSKLSIQVDYQFIKIGLLTPFKNIDSPFYELSDKLRNYQYKIQHSKFQDFIIGQLKDVQNQLKETEAPLFSDVTICGYGLYDQDEFTYFSEIFQNQLNLKLIKQRSVMNSIKAIDYLMNNKEGAFYRYDKIVVMKEIHLLKEGIDINKITTLKPDYPYLYVNVNKSVSFYKVLSKEQMTKLNGSLITDTTIEKLLSLLGLNGDINDHLEKSFKQGDNLKVDMTVEDIYGKYYQGLGLPKDLIACSMGKMQTQEGSEVGMYDIVKSLWYAFAINLGQLAALNAQLEEMKTIIIGSSKITYEPFLVSLQSVLQLFGGGQLEVFYIENSEYLTCLSI